jgi:hypothetical protein
VCLIKKLDSLCRLKINHASGSETYIYSWYTGPHGSEQGCLFAIMLTGLRINVDCITPSNGLFLICRGEIVQYYRRHIDSIYMWNRLKAKIPYLG